MSAGAACNTCLCASLGEDTRVLEQIFRAYLIQRGML
jgi:hypothetical protein